MPEETTVAEPTQTTETETGGGTKTETVPPVETETAKKPESTKDVEDPTLLGKKQDVTAPEKYEVALPEGQEVDSNLLETVTPVLQKHNISQEAFNDLVGVYAPYVQQMVEKVNSEAVESFQKQVGEWKKETLEQLGATAKEDMVVAAKAIDKLGGDELRQVLDDTGLGNHPVIVKAFVKVGKSVSEDTFVEPSKKSQTSLDGMLKTMYPKMSGKT